MPREGCSSFVRTEFVMLMKWGFDTGQHSVLNEREQLLAGRH